MILSVAEKIIHSRANLLADSPSPAVYKSEEEGGCGVVGFACSIPVRGRHIFEPSVQMHNRGNGKGGGIAAVGLDPTQLEVNQEVLDNCYLLQVALLDSMVRKEVEDEAIKPSLKIFQTGEVTTLDDYRQIGLEVKPPEVCRYFVRVKEDVLEEFINKNNLQNMNLRQAEDEFIYQNSFKLNQRFYASLGEKRAFVLSHGRNMVIMKIVGYAEQAVQYYLMEDFKAHIWIAHQRYPTKGRVWHPGGAHPFIGLDEALVHNGDFANYHSVSEYLRQRNIHLLFLTDTEVAALLFDLLNRVYHYPLEYIIEALAPTTELDFDQLPLQKQKIYNAIQSSHIHGSPDGPWLFIIARNQPYEKGMQLIGITDTSMLRPQVFALQEGEVKIGIIASEKQAIDAILHSLSTEDKQFCPVADRYWNARGGSHTDGGAFIFTLTDGINGEKDFVCTDKFGRIIATPAAQKQADMSISITSPPEDSSIKERLLNNSTTELFCYLRDNLNNWDYNTLRWCCHELVKMGGTNDDHKVKAIDVLTLLNNRRYETGEKKRSSILQILNESRQELFGATPDLTTNSHSRYRLIDWERKGTLRPPEDGEKLLIINANGFAPEGDDCDSRLIVEAYKMGWNRFITYNSRGQRFSGCGLGPNTKGVRIDLYDSCGDYLASGIDGLEIYVHGNAQDQLGQIMKGGKLVVYGDVGQTFMYGAKGGEVYVLGNAAGRPLINAVGRPRVVINGTCLDFLAESFMAEDPLKGGGFVILNGLEFDHRGQIVAQPTPYPGSNIFSLASGGAIYVRDPHSKLIKEQLNGGEFAPLTQED